MTSIQKLAKSLSKVVNKRRRLKSESAVLQNSPATYSINHRLSERRVSDFDDTWIRPYAEGIARANDMKNSAIISYERCEGNDYYNSGNEEQNDDLDIMEVQKGILIMTSSQLYYLLLFSLAIEFVYNFFEKQ